ncbi:MAG: anaerobic ribonucleoside-triphosphate reductase activating protein [Epsilonproteobacteria bacterium]|nr:anaerobic ribonucleoside-triphosphate reductase activating protein [Campylobacterota bacterium]
MKIGGFQKTSLLDYPDMISSIVWTVGCNFSCPFCYNTELVHGTAKTISEEEIFDHLKKRKGIVEALVISGGEPFLQKDLDVFCKKVKQFNILIKIDTNGTFPDKLKELIDKKLVDYVAVDIKAPKDKYEKLAGAKVDIKKIQKTIDILQKSEIDYEFKTTFVPEILTKEDILKIAKWLAGSKKYYLQQFKNEMPVLSSELQKINPYAKQELLDVIEEIKPFFGYCSARGV